MTRNWPHSEKCQTAVSVFSFRISLQTEVNSVTMKETLGFCIVQREKCLVLDTLVHKPHRDFSSLVGSQEWCLWSSGKSVCHLLVLRDLRVFSEYKNFFLQAGPFYNVVFAKQLNPSVHCSPVLSPVQATRALWFRSLLQ